MYVQRYILARSRENFLLWKRNNSFIFIVGVDIAVNIIKVFVVLLWKRITKFYCWRRYIFNNIKVFILLLWKRNSSFIFIVRVNIAVNNIKVFITLLWKRNNGLPLPCCRTAVNNTK
jgi:hypothetical protein